MEDKVNDCPNGIKSLKIRKFLVLRKNFVTLFVEVKKTETVIVILLSVCEQTQLLLDQIMIRSISWLCLMLCREYPGCTTP